MWSLSRLGTTITRTHKTLTYISSGYHSLYTEIRHQVRHMWSLSRLGTTIIRNKYTYIILVAANIHYTKIRHHRFVICGFSVDLVQQ
jgi:hypothetical protein